MALRDDLFRLGAEAASQLLGRVLGGDAPASDDAAAPRADLLQRGRDAMGGLQRQAFQTLGLATQTDLRATTRRLGELRRAARGLDARLAELEEKMKAGR